MILDEIVAAKRRAHSAREPRPLLSLISAAASMPPTRDFAAALVDPARSAPRVIAEFKRRSPSAGVLRAGADPADVARSYEQHGAAALSILTDGPFFDGRIADLAAARSATRLPALRKDFLLDERDLCEARLAGADAALLIVRILDQPTLRVLIRLADELGLAVLVEAHAASEIDRALDAGARFIGVNHRDLDTLRMDLSLSREARARIPADAVLVAESGIRTSDDVARMREHGADAILVGEALLRGAGDPGEALAALVGGRSCS